jgi:hypothetical protein
MLRFQPSPDAVAWRRGAAGEQRTARLLSHLERHGWAVLHDLAVPGSPAATRSPHAAFRTLPAVLGPERVADLADQARVRFHAAA